MSQGRGSSTLGERWKPECSATASLKVPLWCSDTTFVMDMNRSTIFLWLVFFSSSLCHTVLLIASLVKAGDLVRFLVHLQYQYGTALYPYYRPSDNANDLELEFSKRRSGGTTP